MKTKRNKNKKLKILIYIATFILAAVIVASVAERLPAFVSQVTTQAHLQNEKTAKEPSLLELVNFRHSTSNRNESELVSVFENKTNSYFVKDKNVTVDKRIMKPLNNMMDAFYAETGLKNVNVISGYRSIETQEALFKKITLTHGKTYAEKYCQKPGFSEHHTGLAIDLSIFHKSDGSSENFKGQGQYAWFYENSWKYGFVRRYDEGKEDVTKIGYEPWHFRYVGIKNAKYMKTHGLCLEEYVEK